MSSHALPSGGQLVLGRYRLIEVLGDGASARVWRAYDTRRRCEVALKLVHPHLTSDPVAIGRLRAEVASARRLRHAGVVRLLDARTEPPTPALAFEFVNGETLAARLAREGGLDPAEVARIAAEVAAALAHAHSRGLVHRDVKPSNILLADDGTVRLLDFGISSSAGESALTVAGTAVGTLPYMAPEQLRGAQAQPATDVYALGVVLYHMLTGRPPFEQPNQVALAEAQLTPPPPLSGASRSLSLAALAALAYEPADRPTAEDVGRLVAMAADPASAPTETVAAVLPGAPSLVAAQGPRRDIRLPVALAALGAAALASAIVLAVPFTALAPPAVDPGEDAIAADEAPTARPTGVDQPAESRAPARAGGAGDEDGDDEQPGGKDGKPEREKRERGEGPGRSDERDDDDRGKRGDDRRGGGDDDD
jgi:eukaryotic-like serine/threonine-protein kinase